MIYMVKEGKENNIISKEVIVEDFLYLTQDDAFIIKKLLLEDNIIKNIKFPEYIINKMIDIIINDEEINNLYNLLAEIGAPLFSLVPISTYKKKYEELKKFKSSNYIIITCNKDNLIRGLELAKILNKNIIINATNISLKDYEKILSTYDLDKLEDKNIKINYQDQNSSISIKELYNLSIKINNISKNIEKYNLSPLEQIIYVYDIVKAREYKKSSQSKDNSRDLDKILKGDTIVCVGYSNLFNAILRNLNINAIPLVSTIDKHQRSIIYINDKKYKIDGVYVCDPTWDRKTKEEYLDNYTYFGITLNDSEKDIESDIYKDLNTPFSRLLREYQHPNSDIRDERKYLTKELFKFVNSDNYEEFEEKMGIYKFISDIEREKIKEIYEDNLSKYTPKDIPEVVFWNALYNVRIIEYYEGIINNLNIEDLIDVVRDKYIFQNNNYSKCQDKTERFFESLEKDLRVRSSLNKELSQNQTTVEKKALNIKLLKLLRNKQKELT